MQSDDDKTRTYVPLTSGAMVSHYRIIEKIGSGGMGEVYLAEDTKLDRKVALKFLPLHLCQDADCRARFKREAQAAAKLGHSNIVAVYEVGEYHGRPFFAMELVEGRPLDKIVASDRLDESEIVELALGICNGLRKAHESGVIHRDIKPSNIIVDCDNVPRVLDFGLAAIRDSDKLTQIGSTLGTIGYMSPEQVAGREVDARSDLFSLGVLLYELITGINPFRRDNQAATLKAIAEDIPKPLASNRSGISVELQRIVSKLLEKRPELRYQTAADLFADFRRCQPSTVPQTLPDMSIVVLPFENLSPDPDQEYFSDGLTEEVISDLSGIAALRVISRSSAMTFKGTKRKVPDIAREVNVRYVLEGSVRKSGNSLRITAQLIDAAADTHLWAEKYSGTMEDVFDIQEKVSRSITNALRVTLDPREFRKIGEHTIDNPLAYDCYLRAKSEIFRWTPDALDRAKQHIENGLDIVGDNALLHGAMAYVCWSYANIGINAEENIAATQEYVRKAFELDPDLPEAHLVLGLLNQAMLGNQQESVRHLKRVLVVAPNDIHAFIWLGFGYLLVGKIALARPIVEKLLSIDPLSSSSQMMLGYLYFHGGRFASAVEPFARCYRMDPRNPFHQFMYPLVLVYNRRTDEARAFIEESVKGEPSDPASVFVAMLKAALDNERHKVLQLLTPQVREFVTKDPQYSHFLAVLCALAGQFEEAMDWIMNAANRGFINYPFLSQHDPSLENLRNDERFKRLLKRVKYEWEHFEV